MAATLEQRVEQIFEEIEIERLETYGRDYRAFKHALEEAHHHLTFDDINELIEDAEEIAEFRCNYCDTPEAELARARNGATEDGEATRASVAAQAPKTGRLGELMTKRYKTSPTKSEMTYGDWLLAMAGLLGTTREHIEDLTRRIFPQEDGIPLSAPVPSRMLRYEFLVSRAFRAEEGAQHAR